MRSASLPKARKFASIAAFRVGALVLLCSSVTQNVDAQRSETIRLGLTVERDSFASPRALNAHHPGVRDSTESRAVRWSHGALIGAGIGVAAGLVTAVIVTHGSGVTDHSEDALAYVYLPAFGAFVGLVIGGIVGLARN
jgi:hypothetical protein